MVRVLANVAQVRFRSRGVIRELSLLLVLALFRFLHFSAPKIVGFHVDKNSSNASCFKVDVLLWSMGFSMIADEQRRNEQRCMSDQSTGWERKSVGDVDTGNSRIR